MKNHKTAKFIPNTTVSFNMDDIPDLKNAKEIAELALSLNLHMMDLIKERPNEETASGASGHNRSDE